MTLMPGSDGGPDGGWPSVSVIVPTVDRPVMMKRAVEAILGQDYPGTIECIVVFDGTEVRVPEIDLTEGRALRGIANARTKGLAGNRNSGYLTATGDLLAGCDDDDEWLPGKLRAQVELLRRSPDASMCITGLYFHFRGKDMARRAPDRPLEYADMLRSRNLEANPCSFLAPRDLMLNKIGLVDEEIPGGYAEDYEWLLRAAQVGSIVCVPEPYVRVHWHEASFYVGQWQTIEQALTYLLARYPDFAKEPAGLARIEGQMAFAYAGMGERRRAVRTALRSLRRSRTPKQSYAALLVATGLVSADRVVSTARRFGHGI